MLTKNIYDGVMQKNSFKKIHALSEGTFDINMRNEIIVHHCKRTNYTILGNVHLGYSVNTLRDSRSC